MAAFGRLLVADPDAEANIVLVCAARRAVLPAVSSRTASCDQHSLSAGAFAMLARFTVLSTATRK